MRTRHPGRLLLRATLAAALAMIGVSTLSPDAQAAPPTGFSDTFKPLVQTVSTSLVYRFNWSGPVVAKY